MSCYLCAMATGTRDGPHFQVITTLAGPVDPSPDLSSRASDAFSKPRREISRNCLAVLQLDGITQESYGLLVFER
jgi:hypothetical protein